MDNKFNNMLNDFFENTNAKDEKELEKQLQELIKKYNTGARYLLMAIYAYLEEEKDLLKLIKKYPEENLEILFPLFAIYYKLGNNKKAKEYLKRINKANPEFVNFFKGTMHINEDIPPRYYRPGDSSEVLMYFDQYDFLALTLPNIHEYILENYK